MNRIINASLFAAMKHRDQRRKDATKSPYINHPLQVADVLATDGNVTDEELLIAALLHDTIEDTETSADEIESRFGSTVLALVLEVTDDKTLEKADRKRLQIEKAPTKSSLAKQLKLADKICNVRDLTVESPAGWPIARKLGYVEWAEKVVEGCKGINAQLDSLIELEISNARKRLTS